MALGITRVLISLTISEFLFYAQCRWCTRNVTRFVQREIESREEKEVPCLEMYRHLQGNWRYDESKMRRMYGGDTGVESYFRDATKAICYIFKPPVMSFGNVTENILECCDGWHGPSCIRRHIQLGRCFKDETCRVPKESFSILQARTLLSIADCCSLLGGGSWQAITRHMMSNLTDKWRPECIKCSNTNLFDEEPESMLSWTNSDIGTSCDVIRGRYIIRFDGSISETRPDCSYRIAESADGTWSVDVDSNGCEDSDTNCASSFRTTIGDDVITGYNEAQFPRTIVTLNNKSLNLDTPTLWQGFIVRKIGYYVILSAGGLTVSWDTKNHISISLDDSNWQADTVGLCGSRKRSPTEYIKSQYESSKFGEWVIEGILQSKTPDSVCKIAPRENTRCTNNHKLAESARKACEIFQMHKGTDFFPRCKENLKPSDFLNVCMLSVCREQLPSNVSLTNIICPLLFAYGRKCQPYGNIAKKWENQLSTCHQDCPKGTTFKRCISACPRTCTNINVNQPEPHCLMNASDCYPGCECKDGLVLKATSLGRSECINPEFCPCNHHGKEYTRGSVVSMECNKCKCSSSGRWNCTQHKCEGICQLVGARHVTTFDRSRITLQEGGCTRHVLVQDRGQYQRMKISVDLSMGGGYSDHIASVSSLLVTIKETRVAINRNFEIFINGTVIRMPYKNSNFFIRMATSHALVIWAFGFSITWMPHMEEIEIVFDAIFHDQVYGICGTYNWNSRDDMLTPEGDIASNPTAFVQSFQTTEGEKPCIGQQSTNEEKSLGLYVNNDNDDPCAVHRQRRDKARLVCTLLTSEHVFPGCSAITNTISYVEMCMADACNSDSPKVICRIFSSYARACLDLQADDVRLEFGWRNHPLLTSYCAPECPNGMLFFECQKPCSSSCEHLRHPCPAYVTKSEKISYDLKDNHRCLPGCECPSEFYHEIEEEKGSLDHENYLLSGTCVPKYQCGCQKNEKFYRPGDTIKSGCSECTCSSGHWSCSSESCSDNWICPNNMIFVLELTRCTEITCDDVISGVVAPRFEASKCEDEFPYQGCGCPSGKVKQGDFCIDPGDCPCQHNGLVFKRNETIKKDCNTCTCVGKHWNCTKNACSGVCIATGDSHYVTFDGLAYTFEGACSYVLAEDKNGIFSITAENVPCGSTGVTCTKSVSITAGKIMVHLLRGKDVTINGAPVRQFPRRYGVVKKIGLKRDAAALTLDKAGLFILVMVPGIGLTVLWDGGTRVHIQLSPDHQGYVSGLCGNYNSRVDDDYKTRLGSIEASPQLFAESWRLSQSCPHLNQSTSENSINPCHANPHREGWARRICGVISTETLFSACRLVLEHKKYYEWCVRDSCACDSGGDCECLCTAIATFAEECNRHGVYVRWRTQDLCPMQCDNGMEYEACGSVCQPTCETSDTELDAHCDNLPCVEGCFCPASKVFHGGACVSAEECSCILGGGEFPNGTQLTDDCKRCTCVGGRWECQGKSCSETHFCAENQFQCSDGSCISSIWHCDGEPDCNDFSDEIECKEDDSLCADGKFNCDDGTCISKNLRCDGLNDCKDGSDEISCERFHSNNSLCEDFEFLCHSGKCIHSSRVCDNETDCGFGDNSDEESCPYRQCSESDRFLCSNFKCISRSKLCNGLVDCADASDETNCGCSHREYTCANDLCIPRNKICDGIHDCMQGEDEHNCPQITVTTTQATTTALTSSHCGKGRYPCADAGECIPITSKCDGVADCPGASDEIDCGLTTMATETKMKLSLCPEFSCDNDTTACVNWRDVCDHVTHCLDESDESVYCWKGCPLGTFGCDNGVKCLPLHWLCDDQLHCRDGSDETELACRITEDNSCYKGFSCGDGICINGSMVCDGILHCSEGDDEDGCLSPLYPPTEFPSSISSTASYENDNTTFKCPEFTCANGYCLDFVKVCNTMDDCKDSNLTMESLSTANSSNTSSDELGCSKWSAWGSWGDCNAACGSGSQTRIRECIFMASHAFGRLFARPCKGRGNDSRPCFIEPCNEKSRTAEPMWSSWSECSVSCGGGIMKRRLQCLDILSCSSQSQSKTCNEAPCAEGECEGGKTLYDCLTMQQPCLKTCSDLSNVNGSTTCSNKTLINKCIPGCYCPAGYLFNDFSANCVPMSQCPCYHSGKMYFQNEKIKDESTCKVCSCLGAGKIGNCRVDESCSQTTLPPPILTPADACGWSEWSDWGPCFGPCGISGVQWSFRSPLFPGRYGSTQHCPGESRKSRRCPTKNCGSCEFNGEKKTVWDQWKNSPCEICECLENQQVECTRFCQYQVIGCPNNGSLRIPDDDTTCCFCEIDTQLPTPTQHPLQYAWDNKSYTTAEYSSTKLQKDDQTVLFTTKISASTATPMLMTASSYLKHTNVKDLSCVYKQWSDWSVCSNTCDTGKQRRHRGIKRKIHDNGTHWFSESFSGPFQEFRSCFIVGCQVNGAWGQWQHWTDCSITCGGGVRFRIRSCSNPIPLNGGQDCNGQAMESEVCEMKPCYEEICSGGRVFANSTSCSMLTSCSDTCSELNSKTNCSKYCSAGCYCQEGQYLQDNKCIKIEDCRCSYNGIEYNPGDDFYVDGCPCVCTNGRAQCYKDKCITDCAWTEWTPWTPCESSCGSSGKRYRYRSPTNPPAYGKGAKQCIGMTTESEQCRSDENLVQTTPCPPVWSTWREWSNCSSKCGIGVQVRIRDCTIGGKPTSLGHCTQAVEYGHQQTRTCVSGKENVTECQEWRKTQITCPENATMECQRCPKTCVSLHSNGVEGACLPEGECTWTCTCPDRLYLKNNQCVHISDCDCSIPEIGQPMQQMLVKAGSSVQQYCKNCTCIDGKLHCIDMKECKNSLTQSFSWTPWSEWTKCSVSCISIISSDGSFEPVFGIRKRTRICLPVYPTQEGKNIGELCDGAATQGERCGETTCSVPLHRLPWGAWTDCDRTCDGGTQTRRKLSTTISKTTSSYQSQYVQTRTCALTPCGNKSCPMRSSLRESCLDQNETTTCIAALSCMDLSNELITDRLCDVSVSLHKSSKKCVNSKKSCVCDNDLLWQEGICVPLQDCNCYFIGKLRRANTNFYVGECLQCDCMNGFVHCEVREDRSSCFENEAICNDVMPVLGPWSHWTTCTKTCDVGLRKRIRSRFAHPSFAELFKTQCKNVEFETQDCRIVHCKTQQTNQTSRHGIELWSSWGECSVTCGGGGWMHRYRSCTYNDDFECEDGGLVETKECHHLLPPCYHDSSWSHWSMWTKCSETCYSMTCVPFRSRVRNCKNLITAASGNYCMGSGTEFTECGHLPSCPSAPQIVPDRCGTVINGSKYSSCGPPCPRTCTDLVMCKESCVPGCYCPPGLIVNENGTACIPIEKCNCYDPASGKYYKPNEDFTDGDTCKKCRCKRGVIKCEVKESECPIKGSWCPWSHWTSCNRPCGKQVRSRERSCKCPPPSDPANVGLACRIDGENRGRNVTITNKQFATSHTEHSECHIFPDCTPLKRTKQGWSNWGEWSQCSCDSFFSSRNRTCNQVCDGPWLEIRPCRFNPFVCGYHCPPGLVLSPCGSDTENPILDAQCPRTCLGFSDETRCNLDRNLTSHPIRRRRWGDCIPQCACPRGLVLDMSNATGHMCVKKFQCPCFSKRLQEASPGVEISSRNFFDAWKQFSLPVNTSRTSNSCVKCTCFRDHSLECAVEASTCDVVQDSAEYGWGPWSSWSRCSAFCDPENQWRARLCLTSILSNRNFMQDDIPCVGPKEQERPCLRPSNCSMLTWEEWSPCSVTCGTGIKTRTRICREKYRCSEERMKEIDQCYSVPCNPSWSQWSLWTACDSDCDFGNRSRARTCTNGSLEFASNLCSANKPALIDYAIQGHESSLQVQHMRCKFKKSCPGSTKYVSPDLVNVKPEWTEWASWSPCSASCGRGASVRKRKCDVLTGRNSTLENGNIGRISSEGYLAPYIGVGCQGERNQSKPCNVAPCPVDGKCPRGMEWMPCQRLCGVSSANETQLETVVKRPISCEELSWGLGHRCLDSSFCFGSCVCEDGGLIQRDGNCVKSDECECTDMKGRLWPPGMEWEEVDAAGCQTNCGCISGKIICQNVLNDRGECSKSSVKLSCAWSTWSPWTKCNATCISGKQSPARHRFRSLLHAGGDCKDDSAVDYILCDGIPPCECINGKKIGQTWIDGCDSCECNQRGNITCESICWSEWSQWSGCSNGCNPGMDAKRLVESRQRKCLKLEKCDDKEILHYNNVTGTHVDQRDCPSLEYCSKGKQDTGCKLSTTMKTISIGGCYAHNVTVNHCSGACMSAVYVLETEPFLHTLCQCCSHQLNEGKPSIEVPMTCSNGTTTFARLPNISNCACRTCTERNG